MLGGFVFVFGWSGVARRAGRNGGNETPSLAELAGISKPANPARPACSAVRPPVTLMVRSRREWNRSGLGQFVRFGTFLPRRRGGFSQTGRDVPKWREIGPPAGPTTQDCPEREGNGRRGGPKGRAAGPTDVLGASGKRRTKVSWRARGRGGAAGGQVPGGARKRSGELYRSGSGPRLAARKGRRQLRPCPSCPQQ